MASDDEQIQQLIENPALAREAEWPRDPKFVARFLRYTLDVMNSEPEAGRHAAMIAWRIVTEPCDRVQVHGLFAQFYRSRGDCRSARLRLELAFELGADCLACLPDLLRRRAFTLRDEKRFSDAIRDADAAIEGYRRLGHPGHDLDGNGLANAYLCRGQVRWETGQSPHCGRDERERAFSGAIEDIGTCLALTDPVRSKQLYGIATHNLASALLSRGRLEDLVQAAHHVYAARSSLSGCARESQERAKLDWLTGMVRYELLLCKIEVDVPGMRGLRPARVCDWLIEARRVLVKLGYVQEASAITADLARIVFPQHRQIERYVADLGKDLVRFGKSVPDELRDPLTRLEQAVLQPIEALVRDEIKEAIGKLREACGPRMLACLISWKPVR